MHPMACTTTAPNIVAAIERPSTTGAGACRGCGEISGALLLFRVLRTAEAKAHVRSQISPVVPRSLLKAEEAAQLCEVVPVRRNHLSV